MILSARMSTFLRGGDDLKAVPIELKEANEFVLRLHRHHSPIYRDKFRVGCIDDSGQLCGIAQCGRPVSRMLDDGKTLEVVRLCTDGTENACSFLYSRCARIAKELGYEHIITYILETESGASLKASGWKLEADKAGGGSWSRPSRPREVIPKQISMFDEKPKYSTERKKRYGKYL